MRRRTFFMSGDAMKSFRSFLCLLLVVAAFPLLASDHADAPNNNRDRATDLADEYMFLDPTDNTRVVMIMTFNGFIVPGENTNLFVFDDNARYVFEVENTGDALPDRFYRVTFSTKTGSATTAQTATIELPDGRTFTAPVTPSNHIDEVAPTPVVTEDAGSGVRFFAGIVDDPFFFDIPSFGRFVASIRAGAPNTGVFSRGRDTFAGYNIQAIALSVPAVQLRGSNGNIVGLSQAAQRRILELIGAGGRVSSSGRFVNVDRQGNPGVNTVAVPFARKNEYNNATPADDAAGKFANDIVGVLKSLGTNDASIGVLASLVVAKGDILRIDTTIANAGFPNGRRLSDDVIDTLLFFAANQNTLGDNVNANDVAFRSAFPFLAPAHQPLAAGAVDNTRN
jgi:hypothetical protein